MKITKSQLKQIIKEELENVIGEADQAGIDAHLKCNHLEGADSEDPETPYNECLTKQGVPLEEKKEDDSFSKAGEEIEKKGTEGVFTAKAKKAGMGVQAYAKQVLAKDSKASTKTKRQAAFAKGASTVAKKRKGKKK